MDARLPRETALSDKPTLLTPAIQKAICDAVAVGVPLYRAAHLAEISEHTVLEWMRRGEGRDDRPPTPEYVAFAQAVRKARAQDQARRIARINKAGQGGDVSYRRTVTHKDGSQIVEERFCEPAWTADAWHLERTDLAHFARTADDQAKAAARQAAVEGISETPDGVPERWATKREVCRWDVERFAATFFDHLTRDPASRMHRDFYADWRADNGARGMHAVTAAPRGHSKTTIKAVIKIVHDCVYEHERFIVVCMHTQTLAEARVAQIRDELETNVLLRDCYGSQRGATWNRGDFVTTKGVRVLAVSPGSQVRGILHHGVRPTKVLCDDIESAIHVQTALQREKMARFYNEDLMKLGTPHTSVEVIGTVLGPESLLSTLLKTPGYRARTYRAVLAFATNVALWQEWRSVFTDLDNPRHVEDARAFYEAHRAGMDEGAEVLWPEHESYYDLMVMRVMEGELAFKLEKQNEPTPGEQYIFAMAEAAYVELMPEGLRWRAADRRVVLNGDLIAVTAYWDPAMGESAASGTRAGDWSCCAVVARDRAGYLYVLDAYLARHDAPDAQVQGVVELLWRWRPATLGLEVNGFQGLLRKDIEDALAERALRGGEAWAPGIVPVTNMRAKPVRISTLQPLVARRHLQFNEALPREFIRQFAEFRPLRDAGHDDCPDAVEGAVRLIRGIA